MSTQKVTGGGTRNRLRKVENFRSFAEVAVFEEDEVNVQSNEECSPRSEEFQPFKVKQVPLVVASDGDTARQAIAADVDASRKQLFEQFEKERQLIIERSQREDMISANYNNFDQLHPGKDLSCLKREHGSVDASVDNRSTDLLSPDVEKGIDLQLESPIPYEEESEEPRHRNISHSAVPAPASENRPEANGFSLLSHYLPAALGDRGISAESELDRLSRQVQVLVHQLAGCQQNLLRAEIEVGVLHEENRELRCLIKDLLAAYSHP